MSQILPLTVVKRKEWDAKTPKITKMLPLVHPVQYVVFTYWTGMKHCYLKSTCSGLVKELQLQHMKDRELADIAYNFVIAPSSDIFEGRGWDNASDKSLPKPDLFGNRIDIAFLGNYLVRPPSDEMLESAKQIIRYALTREMLTPQYYILHLRDKVIVMENIEEGLKK